jgi:hypothetical protein
MSAALVLTMLLIALAFGGSAEAAQRHGARPPGSSPAHSPGTAQCMALAAMKAKLKAMTWTPLTAGQFHFMEGVYVGSPATPEGLPPGDGAELVQAPGEKDGVIVWTRGKRACVAMPVPAKLIELMGALDSGDVSGDLDL